MPLIETSEAVTGEVHVPVFADEVVSSLVTHKEGLYIDGTVGAGGHAQKILSQLGDRGRVLGMDRDLEILHIAEQKLASFTSSFVPRHSSYEDLKGACSLLGVEAVDGILLDLGVSSLQLDSAERGFSFLRDGPLDMRMDRAEETTAQSIVMHSSEKDLEKFFREYGEERFARKLARVIVRERTHHSFETTHELAALISKNMPPHVRYGRIHPATRVFQALRIVVNHELEKLKNFLERAPRFLKKGGRLVILSYHSLEDRIVKQSFVAAEKMGEMVRLTRKPLVPSEEEIRMNPRARSAKMRVAERTL